MFFFIKEKYFLEHSDFKKMLDPGNPTKQAHRTYLCVSISIDGNTFYLPLRNNLGDDVRKFGRIGHGVPSKSRPKAGLDYRYALIINEGEYIETCETPKIPNAQSKKITNDYEVIKAEFSSYLLGYKKAASKNRVHLEALYRESSLINFNDKLGLT